MRVENENESFYEKIESRDREWDESLPWESQFRDRDESLAEVCQQDSISSLYHCWNAVGILYEGMTKGLQEQCISNEINWKIKRSFAFFGDKLAR